MLPAHPRLPSPTALPQRVQLHTRPPVASRAFLGNRRHIPPLQEVRARDVPTGLSNLIILGSIMALNSGFDTQINRRRNRSYICENTLSDDNTPYLEQTTTPGSRGQTAESTERGPGGPHATSSRDGQNGASVDSFGSNGNGNAYSNGNGNGASASQSSSARYNPVIGCTPFPLPQTNDSIGLT